MSDIYPRVLKPALDRAFAAFLLVLLSPLLIGIAIAVRLSSPGRVFYLQDRIGLHERTFRMMKFRTMRVAVDADTNDQARRLERNGVLLKLQSDPRVTAIGRVLRRYSLDELPQLVNVLRGDMSIVGPRPLIPFMFHGRTKERRIRCRVRPGLTGYWQVEARDACTSLDDMWAYDLKYLESVSLRRDVELIARTIPVMLSGKGAK